MNEPIMVNGAIFLLLIAAVVGGIMYFKRKGVEQDGGGSGGGGVDTDVPEVDAKTPKKKGKGRK